MQPSRAAVAVGLVGMVLATPDARADGSAADDAVVLEVRGCAGVAAEAIRHLLQVEIGELLVGENRPTPPASDRLVFRCVGSTVWVEASGRDGRTIERTFSLDDFPRDIAPRVLALAGTELLASLSPAVRARTQIRHEAATPGPQPSAELGKAAPPPPGIRLGLAGVWRTFLVGHGVSAWGGQAQLDWDRGARWQLAADLELAGASRSVKLGDASALLLSGAATLGLRRGTGRVAGTLGAGARVGMARLAGSTSDPAISASAIVRPWGGPLVRAGATGRWSAFALTLKAEAGYSVFTADALAASVSVLAVGGAWAAISLGAAFVP